MNFRMVYCYFLGFNILVLFLKEFKVSDYKMGENGLFRCVSYGVLIKINLLLDVIVFWLMERGFCDVKGFLIYYKVLFVLDLD